MPAQYNLPTIIDVIQDIAQEKGLATTTDTEMSTFINLALLQIRNDHEFSELIESTDLSFTRSATNPYNTVSAPADFWEPIRLNNATDDYHFWYMEPHTLRDLRRADRFTYVDVESAFAKDGSNILIYHDITETLTLYFYSKYLVLDNDGTTQKETPASAGVDADTFRIVNDNLIIYRTLMYMYEKEPDSHSDYIVVENVYKATLDAEKRLNPSQKLSRLESLQFAG